MPRASSPLELATAARLKVSVSTLRAAGDDLYWIEGRPELGGARVVLRWSPGNAPEVISPDGLSLVSRVHEYGGGAMTVVDVDGPRVVGVRGPDQAIVAFRPGEEARTIVDDGAAYGDLVAVPGAPFVLAVRERHDDGLVTRGIVAIDLDGGGVHDLVDGHDFFAEPRLDPDGGWFRWLAWDHPSMPWEAASLFEATATVERGVLHVGEPRRVVGGPGAPVSSVSHGSDGSLLFLLEVGGFVRPHRRAVDGTIECLAHAPKEFGGPMWTLGDLQLIEVDGTVVSVVHDEGIARLVVVEDGELRVLDDQLVEVATLVALPSALGVLGATPYSLGQVARLPVRSKESPSRIELGPQIPLATEEISVGRAVAVDGADGHQVFGLLFEPPGSSEPAPPIVFCHGGPTSSARAGFDPVIQVFTSRGYAVVAADYAGSTGYGARYRHRLDESWGIADVEDCVALVRSLRQRGDVSDAPAAIRGGSAGGYTALLALTTGVFDAAVSWYGVADLLTLVETTHDFESHYTDTLIGPLPETTERYVERSPVTRAAQMRGAVLLLQGLDDPVVPPAQAHAMADALRANGQEVTLLEFEGESHGFRRLETLAHALEAEVAFYELHLRHGAAGAS